MSSAAAVCVALALLLLPAEAKREVKGQNCSQGCGRRVSGGVMEVFAAPKYFDHDHLRDEDRLREEGSQYRWIRRSRNSLATFSRPLWYRGLEGHSLLNLWEDDQGGHRGGLCPTAHDGFSYGCKGTCGCPKFQQCFVHRTNTSDGTEKDIGICNLSMMAQVIISVAAITFLVMFLLIVRMALIQHQVRQELYLRENAQENGVGVIREIEPQSFTPKRQEHGGRTKSPTPSARTRSSTGRGSIGAVSVGSKPGSGKTMAKRGRTPERPHLKSKDGGQTRSSFRSTASDHKPEEDKEEKRAKSEDTGEKRTKSEEPGTGAS